MKIASALKRLKDPKFRTLVDSKYGLGRFEKLIFANWFNPFLTLWINFRSLPIKKAIFLPIWIYGRPRLYCLSGRIKFNCKIKSGIVKFNLVKFGAPSNMSRQSEIYNLGSIVFNGRIDIGTGSKIIVSYDGEINFGDMCKIMDNCTLASHEYISIGYGVVVANNCQITDTNFHFIADFNKEIIPRRTKKISIGKSCWICNSSSIMMGAVLPNYAIVGSHSIVNKDFSQIVGGCIIAGAPAKLIKEGFAPVFNTEIEDKIWKYWNQEASSDVFPIGNLTIEDISIINRL